MAKSIFLGELTLSARYRDPHQWTDLEETIVEDHFHKLVRDKEAGIVVMAGRLQYTPDHPDLKGLVVFFAEDETSALAYLQHDPAVLAGIMVPAVHPFAFAVHP
jgi:hypothetical protein